MTSALWTSARTAGSASCSRTAAEGHPLVGGQVDELVAALRGNQGRERLGLGACEPVAAGGAVSQRHVDLGLLRQRADRQHGEGHDQGAECEDDALSHVVSPSCGDGELRPTQHPDEGHHNRSTGSRGRHHPLWLSNRVMRQAPDGAAGGKSPPFARGSRQGGQWVPAPRRIVFAKEGRERTGREGRAGPGPNGERPPAPRPGRGRSLGALRGSYSAESRIMRAASSAREHVPCGSSTREPGSGSRPEMTPSETAQRIAEDANPETPARVGVGREVALRLRGARRAPEHGSRGLLAGERVGGAEEAGLVAGHDAPPRRPRRRPRSRRTWRRSPPAARPRPRARRRGARAPRRAARGRAGRRGRRGRSRPRSPVIAPGLDGPVHGGVVPGVHEHVIKAEGGAALLAEAAEGNGDGHVAGRLGKGPRVVPVVHELDVDTVLVDNRDLAQLIALVRGNSQCDRRTLASTAVAALNLAIRSIFHLDLIGGYAASASAGTVRDGQFTVGVCDFIVAVLNNTRNHNVVFASRGVAWRHISSILLVFH